MVKPCSIQGCAKPLLARGWCSHHYSMWAYHGSPEDRPFITPESRFWAKVKKSNGCWIWTGAIAGKYGQCRSAPNVKTPAHRFSWNIHFGEIPNGLFVCHKCDNPLCVNPSHLFLGDARDNMNDMVAKGRHPKQLSSYRAKLNPEQVLAIRKSAEPTLSLAKEHRVDASTIRAIKLGRSWRHI